jgi:hypothetical protein
MDPPSLEPQLMMSAGTFVGVSLSQADGMAEMVLDQDMTVVQGVGKWSVHWFLLIDAAVDQVSKPVGNSRH